MNSTVRRLERIPPEIWQEIVRVRLAEVRPVEVQTEEHDESPGHDKEVDLPDDALDAHNVRRRYQWRELGRRRLRGTLTYSSRQVHRAEGSKRCAFSQIAGGR